MAGSAWSTTARYWPRSVPGDCSAIVWNWRCCRRSSARPLGVLSGTAVPLIRPGGLRGAPLVFLWALGEFGVPTFLRYNVFSVESFTQFSAFYNFGAATAAAVPLALLTFVVLSVEWLA